MWRVRPYRGAMAEHTATRAWTAADRQGARSGTAAGMPAVLREGAGGSVDQVEGDELNHDQVALSLDAHRATRVLVSRPRANGAVCAADLHASRAWRVAVREALYPK